MQTEKIIDHIVHWLAVYCRDSGLNGFVVGVSGGIDSAVTSTLCARTQKEVLAVNMPIYQSPDQISLSDRHIGWLAQHYPNVKGIKIDLTGAFHSLEETFPAGIQDGLTMANTRARVRMLTLYAFAGHHRMLVAGTGNKVEDFGVGFYTKYGDGGVDLSPIADLVKTEVYALGKAMGVCESILQAPPTDGLWGDNRTDESQIGASYAELEWVMNCEEKDHFPNELNARQREVLSIYRKFRAANRHKMMSIPVCRIPDSLKAGSASSH